VIANGDITSLAVANDVIDRTHVKGVMSARGILNNPALFAGLWLNSNDGEYLYQSVTALFAA
jgi:tRNA-dihydrouridine synthase